MPELTRLCVLGPYTALTWNLPVAFDLAFVTARAALTAAAGPTSTLRLVILRSAYSIHRTCGEIASEERIASDRFPRTYGLVTEPERDRTKFCGEICIESTEAGTKTEQR